MVILRSKVLLEYTQPPALAAAQGQKRKLVFCTNFHICSGSKNIKHDIPGRGGEKKTEFKQNVLLTAIDTAVYEAESRSRRLDADPQREHHPVCSLVNLNEFGE